MTPTTAHAVPRPLRAHGAHRSAGLLAAGVLALLALLLTGGTASAHDVVTGSDPADGATLADAPTQVSVTFDDSPQPGLAALTVVGPDGTHHEQGQATIRGDAVSVPVGPLPVAGEYEVGYRIVSSDGHPVTGSISFTLTDPSSATAPAPGTTAAGAPAPAGHGEHAGHPTAPPSPAAAAGDDSAGGVPSWVFVVIAVVVVAGAVALVLRRRA